MKKKSKIRKILFILILTLLSLTGIFQHPVSAAANTGYMVKMPMFKYKYMAHAMGGLLVKDGMTVKKYTYCNTMKAFKASKANGIKYFEVDLTLSKDRKVTLSHGWDKSAMTKMGLTYKASTGKLTEKQFLKRKIHGFMAPMTLKALYKIMKQNPDIYFELDIHDYTKKSCARIARQLVSVCKKDPKILNRFLIQVHNQKMYNGFYSVYHFKYFQYVSSAAVKKNIKGAIAFCRKNKIGAIALRTSLASKETIQKLKKAGLHVLVFTTDSKAAAEKYLSYGADTICTNFLY